MSVVQAAKWRGVCKQTLKKYLLSGKVMAVCQLYPPYYTLVPFAEILREINDGIERIGQLKARGYVYVSKDDTRNHPHVHVIKICNKRYYFFNPKVEDMLKEMMEAKEVA